MLLLADSENKYNLLDTFAAVNVFFFLKNHWCTTTQYYNNKQNNDF